MDARGEGMGTTCKNMGGGVGDTGYQLWNLKSHRNKQHSIRNTVNNSFTAMHVRGGSYTCDEYSIMYKLVLSLCCVSEN